MPQRSNAFQKLVFLINSSLQENGKVVESALLTDKVTGENREVDILLSISVATYPIMIGLEVIDRNRKADVQWVEQMHSKHLNLPTDKVVLVSRSGFYKPALTKAHFYGIETITLEEALETDWDLATRMLTDGFFEIFTYNYKCSATFTHPDGEIFFESAPLKTTVYLPYRETSTDFENIVLFFLNEPHVKKTLYECVEETGEKGFAFRYTPQAGTYVLDEVQTKMELIKFEVELEMLRRTTPIKFSVGRYRDKAVILGNASDPKQELCFALLKNSDKNHELEGFLYDDKKIIRLTGVTANTTLQRLTEDE